MEILINRGPRRFLRILLLLVICMASAPTVLCQPGFLSIDCGSDNNYTDKETGIFWETDYNYISTGRNLETLVQNYPPDHPQLPPMVNQLQAGTIRYFDEPLSRDCYVLPVQQRETYLLRLTFYYGNIGIFSENTFGSFEVWVDSNNWLNLAWDNYTAYYYTDNYELVYSASRSNLNVCLVRIQGPSFLSALELRQLATGMYASAVGPTRSSWLFKATRANFGPSGPVQQWRYPNDTYDRIWQVYSPQSTGGQIIGNRNIRSSPTSYALDPDRPPLVVMRHALVKGTIAITLPFGRYNVSTSIAFYIATYFQELDGSASATGNVRGMDYYVNDVYIRSFNISDAPSEISVSTFVEEKYWLNISLGPASWSSLAPSVNALEVYQIYPWDTTRTAPEDVSTLYALQVRLSLLDWTGDPCFPFAFDWLSCSFEASPRITTLSLANQGFEGNIPIEILNLTALTNLTLNGNKFNGSIPDFSSLVNLQVINLQNNDLSGDIPNFLGNAFPNLTQLNLSDNSLSGTVPTNLNKSGLYFTVLNNPSIINCTIPACGYVPPAPPPVQSGSGPSSTGTQVLGGILGGVAALAIAIIVGITWMLCTRQNRARLRIVKAIEEAENHTTKPMKIPIKPLGSSLTLLTLQEVSDATTEFSRKIGEGAFGPVYYGKLPSGKEVAVKVKKSTSRQGIIEFLNEVDLLSRIHHRNLVSLIGYCKEDNQHILIYLYFSKGTLQDHLYGDQSRKLLTWSTRLDIALNSAKGLAYLHTNCHPPIIHRDVKSSNILLDENMVAKVADFGLSRQTPQGISSGVDTMLKGTIGYLDPVYVTSQRLTQKSDVYSFGVVLLEIISGRHPYVSEFPDGTRKTLLEWVRSTVDDGRAMDIIDPFLNGDFAKDSMMKVISLAISCIDLASAKRPSMVNVVCMLGEAIELELFSKSIVVSNQDFSSTSD
ncbi:unnamed protein product [Calypogeia fissa]